ncbi:hypothetical protein ONZ51_g9181 [Trametes cubensis]|uniref:Casein kinase substrate phosphoprotein PP28 domain-containing protein n=1 Tax=Trametes cubensis TaxID=1111947 RepID=A0AAD7TLW5_9APHY|nr:hypothetical protein ONZ51_g9181 [Trametes cubensis]
MARGTFKQKRGGGRKYVLPLPPTRSSLDLTVYPLQLQLLNSKHLTLDENGTAVATDRWAPRGRRTEGDDDDDDEDDDEEEEEEESEESEDDAPAAPSATGTAQPELSRAERRELKKKKGQAKQQANGDGEEEDEDEDPLLANPNIAAGKRLNISDLSAPRELSRKERQVEVPEAKEKKEAQERYWKLHAQGKTDQAKADLARLAKIRAEREAAQAKRKAEAEAKAAEIEAKKKEQMAKAKRS